jgi:hypothetical protein
MNGNMAKSNKAKDKDLEKISKSKLNDIGIMDTIVDKMIMSLDDNHVSNLNLSEKNAEFKSIINDELEVAKGISKGSIVDFTRALTGADNVKRATTIKEDDDLYKYIAQNSGSIYQTFNERYKNKFIEMQDLNFISTFVPSLGQAVRIALNHITCSDDLSGSFTRSLDFGSNLSPDDTDAIKRAIEQFENETKLLYKLKNTCYKNCFVTGRYYIYAVSYSKLFTEYSKSRSEINAFTAATNSKSSNFSYTSEGVTYDRIDEAGCVASTCALESADLEEVRSILKTQVKGGKPTVDSIDSMNIKNAFLNGIADVYTLESAIPSEILETMPGIEASMKIQDSTGDKFRKIVDYAEKSTRSHNYAKNAASDGTYSTDAKNEKFDITGTFIKFIDATKVIPIKILDETVGYLYVESKTKKKDQEAARFIAGELTNVRRDDAVDKVANLLTSKIVKNFSSKFVADNIQFKNLIANCILANGIINQEYRIQFIPTTDMIEFNVNIDENGEGTSSLKNALFPAKLLTSYVLKKYLNYVNKSGDKTIAHIRGGQADISRRNQVMRIIRNLQEQNVTFGDMMSDYSMMFHKYASDNNIVMPMGRNGNRLVEFEKMDGQNIDMNTEWEKNLENQALLATGVPPLLIEQYNQADFSKAYTTAHIGFAGMVAGWQSDLETSTTELYKRIIENLDVDDGIKQRVLPTFQFKLPRPKSLSVVNNTEALGNASNIADTFVQLKYGEVSQDDEIAKAKANAVKLALVKELTPFVDWEKLEEVALETELTVDNIKTGTSGGGENDIAGASEF